MRLGTISENTASSRTRRAISWAYWAPKSTTSTAWSCSGRRGSGTFSADGAFKPSIVDGAGRNLLDDRHAAGCSSSSRSPSCSIVRRGVVVLIAVIALGVGAGVGRPSSAALAGHGADAGRRPTAAPASPPTDNDFIPQDVDLSRLRQRQPATRLRERGPQRLAAVPDLRGSWSSASSSSAGGSSRSVRARDRSHLRSADAVDADEFRRAGHELIDWIADHLEGIERLPRGARRRSPATCAPGSPRTRRPSAEPLAAVLADLDDVVVPGDRRTGSTRASSPTSPSNTTYPSILGELLSAGLGVQGMSWVTSPACTELETLRARLDGRAARPARALPQRRRQRVGRASSRARRARPRSWRSSPRGGGRPGAPSTATATPHGSSPTPPRRPTRASRRACASPASAPTRMRIVAHDERVRHAIRTRSRRRSPPTARPGWCRSSCAPPAARRRRWRSTRRPSIAADLRRPPASGCTSTRR